MLKHPSEAVLNDYVDDALAADVYEFVNTHVGECVECAARVGALRVLLAAAESLPASIEPPPELWADLRAVTIDAHASRAAVLRSLRMPLAAAALVLVALASVLTWWVTSTTRPTRVVVRDATGGQYASLVAMKQADTDHLEATRVLLEVFAQRRSQLDPAVVLTVEQNLRIMNSAIEGAKAALASDPANQDVASILTTTYQSKVRMLRNAVRVSGQI